VATRFLAAIPENFWRGCLAWPLLGFERGVCAGFPSHIAIPTNKFAVINDESPGFLARVAKSSLGNLECRVSSFRGNVE